MPARHKPELPNGEYGMTDWMTDSILESVEKLIANSAGDISARRLVAHVMGALADELPEHIGPGAQWAYRGWLRRRAEAIETNRGWRRTILAETPQADMVPDP